MSHLSQIPEFWKRLKMIIFYSTFKTFLALPYDLHFSIISCVRFVNSTMSKTSSFLHIYSEKATVFQMWVWANYNLISITQVFWKQIYHFTKNKKFSQSCIMHERTRTLLYSTFHMFNEIYAMCLRMHKNAEIYFYHLRMISIDYCVKKSQNLYNKYIYLIWCNMIAILTT